MRKQLTPLAGVTSAFGKKRSAVTVLAHRLYGPGYASGAAPLTGDGTLKTYSGTFVNESGATISVASVVLQGWTLRTTGTTDASASFDVTGTVEYPIAGTTTSIGTVTVTAGGNIASGALTLATPIPPGASFAVNLSSTPGNGNTYIANLGFAGLRVHAMSNAVKAKRLGAFGDSIMTNNSGAVYNAASGKCPAYVNSISGTTAQTYGASAAAGFARQSALCAVLGLTDVISNFGTNDFGASSSLASVQGWLTAMRDMVRAAGMRFVQTTMLPRTGAAATIVTASSVTSVGTSMSVVVPNATLFTVGHMYTVAGAVQTEYNQTCFCTAINTGANTLTLLFPGSGTPTATGTITVTPWKPVATAALTSDYSAFFAPGGASSRGLFNAWVRGGAFDSFIEWADACETARDTNKWKEAGSSLLLAYQAITVSSVITTSRFNSDYSRGSGTIPNGRVQAQTGGNAGSIRTGNGNTLGDITVSTAWGATQNVSDQYLAMPGVSYMSDDGTHPRVAAAGYGGQAHLDAATLAWIG